MSDYKQLSTGEMAIYAAAWTNGMTRFACKTAAVRAAGHTVKSLDLCTWFTYRPCPMAGD